MANTSKAQLIARAKALGLKVDDGWTRRNLEDAISIAEADAEVMQDDTDDALGEIGMPTEPEPTVAPVIPAAAEVPPVLSSLATPVPTPPTVSAPPSIPKAVVAPASVVPAVSKVPTSNLPSKPRIGAGRYRVLWTITLPDGPHHDGEVTLTDAQARSLVDQGAVIHVDDYPAYVARMAATKATAKPMAHPAKIPSGAGRYRTVGGVMRNGKEIPHGTVADFTAAEVVALTKPGMVAIEYAD
jgi:hypothetical protein